MRWSSISKSVPYRDLEGVVVERGVTVDHAPLNLWVVKFGPPIASQAQATKRPTAPCSRMDETYIKVKGRWTNLDRAVGCNGQALDFLLSERRDLAAARRFFKQAINANGQPDRVDIDKSGANLTGLQAANVIPKFADGRRTIEIRPTKYLPDNNILERDHRFIKRITAPMVGFKTFLHSAAATIAGIEDIDMIRKGQIPANGASPFQIAPRSRHDYARQTGVVGFKHNLRRSRDVTPLEAPSSFVPPVASAKATTSHQRPETLQAWELTGFDF